MYKQSILAASIAVLSACATGADEEPVNQAGLDRLASLEPTGEIVNCLPSSFDRSTVAVTEKLFLLRVGVNKWYLTETGGRCDGATRSGVRYQYVIRGGRFCAKQLLEIVDSTSNFSLSACSLGPFREMRPKSN